MSAFRYSLEKIAEITEGELEWGAPEQEAYIEQIEYDTRQVYRTEGTLFVALKSEYRDGHRFLAEAARKGISNFLISDHRIRITGVNFVRVGNTLEALQALSAHHRQQFTGQVVAITGSNGKTIV